MTYNECRLRRLLAKATFLLAKATIVYLLTRISLLRNTVSMEQTLWAEK